MKNQLLTSTLIACLSTFYTLSAQTPMLDSLQKTENTEGSLLSNWRDRFTVSAYGSMNYNRYKWQILPTKRNDFDLERVVIETGYKISPRWSLQTELEFEHGGTGVSVEFDPLEEFGEFEYDVSKGGEIWLEQFHFKYKSSDKFDVSFGRLKVPFGINNYIDEPTEYRTANVAEMENTLLPTHWTEFGAIAEIKFGTGWHAYGGFVTGLDGSNFNSANFVKRGNQRRFETVVAEDWAVVGRLDYEFGHERFVGVSSYFGNTTHNRPKPDLKNDTYLTLTEAHIVLEFAPFAFKAMGLFGQLQNSEALSNANRNLSNNLNVKRTPVGKQAVGASVELAFEPFDLLKKHPNGELYVFGRYDFYDTQFATQGLIFDNPRWERSTVSFGANYLPTPWLVFKAQFSRQLLGISVNRQQDTFTAGLGFYLK